MICCPLLLGSPISNAVLLLGSFALLILGAEIFTNGVEWLGHRLGISESATGSLLAAVGTALPETMIPVIAILSVVLGIGDQAAADEVGVGAILGAPFMLATIAMFLIGISVLYYADRRIGGATFELNQTATKRDMSFFIVGYLIAVLAAFVPNRSLEVGAAITLVGLYGVYVYRSLQSGQLMDSSEMEALHLASAITEDERPFPSLGVSPLPTSEPRLGLVITQMMIALGVIIVGAHLFVTEVQFFARTSGVPPAIVALLLAPLATELPEKFNSIIWIAEGKDTLAIGNISGAMVFQGTLPATLGILFTSWDLTITWGTVGFLNLLSAGLALIGGGLILVRVTRSADGRLNPTPFLLGGGLYAIFIASLIYHVVVLGVTTTPH